MLDFHNHLMPAVDDGAASVEESREGLEAFSGDGVGAIITTPHFQASLTLREEHCGRALAVIDRGWSDLTALARREFPRLVLERGVELLLDHPSADLSDPRLRLAGTSFVLIEFPFVSVPPHSTLAIRALRTAGWRPIIAHPERYSGLANRLEMIEGWKDAGAFIQVNAGSLVGRYGKRARAAVWEILSAGHAEYICSDYHSRGPTLLGAARQAMEDEDAFEQWRLLTTTNPERILVGDDPVQVGPIEPVQRSLWKRFTSRS